MYFSGNNKNYLLMTALAAALAACGPAPRNSAAPGAPVTDVAPSASYVTGSQLPAVVSNPSRPAETPAEAPNMVIPKGTEVTVLETRDDPAKGAMVRLGIDSDDPNQASDVWVSKADALKAGLIMTADSAGDPANDPADGDLTEEAAARRRMTYCYRFVKQYLLQTGKVHTYLPGGSAWMAASTLPRYGFRGTGSGPSGAQEGDVCVYSGGNGGNGHIEVKRGGGWWYGYGVKPHPITPVNHRLLGCFRK